RKVLAGRWAERREGDARQPLPDVAFTANAGRAHMAHRLAFVARSTAQVREELSAVAAGLTPEGMGKVHVPGSELPKVAFLFTGQGSQYAGMGRALYEKQPTFRRALDQCEDILRGDLKHPLLSVMHPETGANGLLDETEYTQPALFALEFAIL